MPAIERPVSSAFGNTFTGSLVSSAMFTESSKPTIAKNASDVAAVTAMKAFLSVAVSNATTREKSTSAPPPVKAHKPTMMTSNRPVISMMVSPTLSFTLSPTPRKFTAASIAMNSSATMTIPALPQSRSKAVLKLAAKNRDAVDAEVMPEHITTNATRNVTNCTPNALCAYSAAPAACGYLVTSSR